MIVVCKICGKRRVVHDRSIRQIMGYCKHHSELKRQKIAILIASTKEYLSRLRRNRVR